MLNILFFVFYFLAVVVTEKATAAVPAVVVAEAATVTTTLAVEVVAEKATTTLALEVADIFVEGGYLIISSQIVSKSEGTLTLAYDGNGWGKRPHPNDFFVLEKGEYKIPVSQVPRGRFNSRKGDSWTCANPTFVSTGPGVGINRNSDGSFCFKLLSEEKEKKGGERKK